ncbi:hypothetical protein L7F22_051759 [Adiantum nelumboides]|nr:hypothetical protein [Adiantum nelumboides]
MSARRPRTSNRRYGKGKEERSTDRDDDAGEKSKQKKRKLSDLLGPPWSEDDLKHFYQSYRRHGRDWKKVAATFHNRTVEMVEVLYNMNKAYLSLPEGAASAAGLIAMMTDHYNILEDSRSLDEDSSKDVAASMPSNQVPARLRSTSSTQQGMKAGGVVPQLSGLSSYGGPSPAKKPRTVAVNRPRAVGKRTPRVPLMHLQGITKSGKLHLSEPMEDAEQDSFGDCDEFKVALTLASASQRAASPQISRTPACRSDRSKSLPVQNGHTNNKTSCAGSGSFETKHTGSNMDDGASEESRDTDNGVVTKASMSTALERRKRMSPAGEAKSKLKKSQKSQTKTGKLYGFDNFRSDELKEECSCTEEGTLKHEDTKGVDGYKNEQASKKKRPPSQKTKKRSRQLFSGDERSGLDALATLADLSLNGLLPSPRLDGEGSSMRILDLSKDNTTERIRWSASEDLALHTEPQYGQSKETLNSTAKGFLTGRQKEIHCTLDIGSNFEPDVEKGIAIAELRKRKRRGLSEKRDQFSDGNIAEEDRVDAKVWPSAKKETSKEQRSNDTKGKDHVVKQPLTSIGHRQPSTDGLVNGQDSNEQTMRQTIPLPMSNAGCFGGGSVFQVMIRPSPALHGFMPDNAYGAMPPGGSNPMYGNIGVQPGFQCAAGSYGMPGANMGMAGFAQPDAQN